MSMTPRERILAVYNGEEPDKIPVVSFIGMLYGRPDWEPRLRKRGMGLIGVVAISDPPSITMNPTYTPFGWQANRRLTETKYTRTDYFEKGKWKYRQTWETPVGTITGVTSTNPDNYMDLINTAAPEEYPVKKTSDWRVVNYYIKDILEHLVPKYDGFEKADKDMGERGIIQTFLSSTAWQRAWMFLAGPERALIDFHEQSDDIKEYIELVRLWHARIAEFAAECPIKFIDIAENVSDMASPAFYGKYFLPIYETYAQKLKGTGKILGAHMDGRLGKLKKEIAESPLDVIESFSLPPTGDISLTEAKKIWPGKMLFMNTAPHMAWAKPEEVREYYEYIANEWGSKKGLLLEFSELLPPQTVEAHLSAAMDAFGY